MNENFKDLLRGAAKEVSCVFMQAAKDTPHDMLVAPFVWAYKNLKGEKCSLDSCYSEAQRQATKSNQKDFKIK